MRPLSVGEIEEARAGVLENSRELVQEAELQLSTRKHARAYALARLACEEMAKIPMVVRAATDSLRGRKADWAKVDRRLHNHSEKTIKEFSL